MQEEEKPPLYWKLISLSNLCQLVQPGQPGKAEEKQKDHICKTPGCKEQVYVPNYLNVVNNEVVYLTQILHFHCSGGHRHCQYVNNGAEKKTDKEGKEEKMMQDFNCTQKTSKLFLVNSNNLCDSDNYSPPHPFAKICKNF
jgi:hypothetical protein